MNEQALQDSYKTMKALAAMSVNTSGVLRSVGETQLADKWMEKSEAYNYCAELMAKSLALSGVYLKGSTEDPWNELVRSNCENLAAI